METYFSKFPVIQYDNRTTRNLTERIKVLNNPRITPENFYPFEIKNAIRPDQIAQQYYADATLDWLIYLVNNIVDPYYGWTLNQEDFDAFIIKKYGSIDIAQQSIAAFRTNWPSDQNNLTVAYYNSLPDIRKKYYEPIWGSANKIIGYQRRQIDWFTNTNKIIRVTVNNSFPNNELIITSSGGLDKGKAEIISANSTNVILKNVVGDISSSQNIRLRSNTQSNGTLTNVKTIQNNIDNDESAMWEAAYWYDVENELNSFKRYIDLLESNYALETAEGIRKQLQK